MKYITTIPTGFELRSDTSQELPLNSFEITEEQYEGILNGTLKYVDGKVIPV